MKKECKNSIWNIKLLGKNKVAEKSETKETAKTDVKVDIQEFHDKSAESAQVNISLEKENKDRLEFSLNKEKKYIETKEVCDWEEKANNLSVEFSEDKDENFETLKMKMKLEKEEKELLQVSVKKKSKTRFKAGADLTEKVNLVDVNFIEELDSETETFAFNIKLSSGICAFEAEEEIVK